MAAKVCSRCRQLLPQRAFAIDSGRVDGLYPYCTDCHREKNRRSYLKAREKRLAKAAAYRDDNRAAIRQYATVYNRRNRLSIAAQARLHRKTNQAAVRSSNRRHYELHKSDYLEANHRRRARKHTNGPVERIYRRVVWTRDNGCCYLCGNSVALADMHLEHKIPLSKGGQHTYANVGCACAACNLAKHAKTPEEYLHVRS
jgi:5-methylcytosine-specific restriction endonuclease McrA